MFEIHAVYCLMLLILTLFLFINFREHATYFRLSQQRSGPIHMCKVHCNGTETDLMECWQDSDGFINLYCFHYYDIYVKCERGKTTNMIFSKLYLLYILHNLILCNAI